MGEVGDLQKQPIAQSYLASSSASLADTFFPETAFHRQNWQEGCVLVCGCERATATIAFIWYEPTTGRGPGGPGGKGALLLVSAGADARLAMAARPTSSGSCGEDPLAAPVPLG